MHDNDPPLKEGTEVRTYFVRERNALVARGDFGELFVEYYLHLHDHGLSNEPGPDQLLKDTLTALTLHAASRPWNETISWTINLQSPHLNLFAAADNHGATIAGNVFTENVRENPDNLIYATVIRGTDPARRSVVNFTGSDIFLAVETYYLQSEQRPARYFQLGDEDFVLISAQPDCDLAWLENLDLDAAKKLDETETLSLLETRRYQWSCGCSEEKLIPMLVSVYRQNPDSLFGTDPAIRISCPRCGAKYIVSREQVEKFTGF